MGDLKGRPPTTSGDGGWSGAIASRLLAGRHVGPAGAGPVSSHGWEWSARQGRSSSLRCGGSTLTRSRSWVRNAQSPPCSRNRGCVDEGLWRFIPGVLSEGTGGVRRCHCSVAAAAPARGGQPPAGGVPRAAGVRRGVAIVLLPAHFFRVLVSARCRCRGAGSRLALARRP